jgi:hypothetical protein
MIPKTPPLLLTLALICDWHGWTAPLPAQDVLFPYSPSLQPPDAGDHPPWMPPPFFPFAGVEPSPGPPSWTAVRAQPSSGDRSWLADWQDSRSQRKAKGQAVVGPAILTAQTVVRDSPGTTWDDPLFKREWKTDESWRLPVLGPFFVFGQLGANGDENASREVKVVGRTGLACKIPVGAGEVVLRSGPSLSHTDPRGLKDRSEMLVEVQARWPLLAHVGLEYQGSAAPALSPLDKDWVNQDVSLAFLLGTMGKFKVGAKQHWENLNDPRAWTEGRQLYLGLELTR